MRAARRLPPRRCRPPPRCSSARTRACAPSRWRGSSNAEPTTPAERPAAPSSLSLLAQGQVAPPDHYEPNDNAGPWAHALPPLPRTIEATLDYWDDNLDVYRVYLHEGRRLYARVTAHGGSVRMSVWAPGTQRVDALDVGGLRVAQSRTVGSQSRVAYRAIRTGVYYLELRVGSPTFDPLSYRLALARG